MAINTKGLLCVTIVSISLSIVAWAKPPLAEVTPNVTQTEDFDSKLTDPNLRRRLYQNEAPRPPGLGWEVREWGPYRSWARQEDWWVVQDLRRQVHELEQRVKVLENVSQPRYPDVVVPRVR